MKKIISVIGLVSAAAVSLGATATGAPVAWASSVPKVQEAGWVVAGTAPGSPAAHHRIRRVLRDPPHPLVLVDE